MEEKVARLSWDDRPFMLKNQYVRDVLLLYSPHLAKCNPAGRETKADAGIFQKKSLEPFPYLPGFRSEAFLKLRNLTVVATRSNTAQVTTAST
ncbi:MAG: hypothetical protein NTAFB01_11140 [Nitrospira sp.]